MEITGVVVLGVYLLAGAAAWAWIGWRRRRKPVRRKGRRPPQAFPLLTGFLLLLTWPLALWEEARAR
jgi:hypothetical protein